MIRHILILIVLLVVPACVTPFEFGNEAPPEQPNSADFTGGPSDAGSDGGE